MIIVLTNHFTNWVTIVCYVYVMLVRECTIFVHSYTYVSMLIQTCTFLYICLHASIYGCMLVRGCTKSLYVCVLKLYMLVYVCTYLYIFIHGCTCFYICFYILIHMCTYLYICLNACTCNNALVHA